MDIRKSTLSAAIAALLTVGMVGQASAYTSAGSKVEYTDLAIIVDGLAGGGVTTFNFVTSGLAKLDTGTEQLDADSQSCAGNLIANTCAGGSPRLTTKEIQVGTPSHTPGTYDLDGPDAGTQYSYAQAEVTTAQLAGDALTSAALIAETELLTSGGGNSNSTIQSTTNFEFIFSVGDSGTFDLRFKANPEAYSASDNPGSTLTIAESSYAAEFLLTKNNADDSATWNPDGDITNGCAISGGTLSCSEEEDGETLNDKTAIGTDPAEDYLSDNGATFSDFHILVSGLSAGDWTFTLTTTVANSVTKVRVPEPGIVLLLGAGLAGFGVARRKIKKA